MSFFKVLHLSLISITLLTTYHSVLAEEPIVKTTNNIISNYNSDTNSNNGKTTKHLTVNGVSITFTNTNEALIEINGQLVKINTVAQSATVLPATTVAETATDINKETSSNNTEETSSNNTEKEQTKVDTASTDVDAEDYYAYELVNLPTPKRYEKGAFNVHFTHRFSQSPFARSASDLFGFDSFSVSAFGFTYGITNRIYTKIYRSPLFRTIEMGGGAQLLHQNKSIPVSASIYASVEGTDNFNEHFTTNIAGTIGRSISRYGGVFFAPTVSFNNNPIPNSNNGHTNTTGSFGFGGQINFRPTGSFVLEFVPRVGYKSPGSVSSVAFGLQKRTYRHTFTLTVSNGQGTTTSQYNVGFGSITDRKEFARGLVVGFNIYRRFF